MSSGEAEAPERGAAAVSEEPTRHPGRSARTADSLLRWFHARERDVPWRAERDPYRIWVAEVMAQQTRLETMRPYYSRFLERFPSVRTLAIAEQDEVLKTWEGLGYYARARNLQRAARAVVADHAGQLPSDPDALRRLPGIGPYTAGAVASIAFGLAEPAVDGNARRVLSRLFDLERPTPRRLDAVARGLLEARRADVAEINQALMDLGGEICTPKTPSCEICPLAVHCLALHRGTLAVRPPARPRRELPHQQVAVGVVWRNGRVLIARRPEDGLLGGLWEFPGGKIEPGETPEETVVRELREEMEIEVAVGDFIDRVKHAYSHFRVTLDAYHATLVSGEPKPRAATACRWVAPEALRKFAFPRASHPIVAAARRLTQAEMPPNG